MVTKSLSYERAFEYEYNGVHFVEDKLHIIGLVGQKHEFGQSK